MQQQCAEGKLMPNDIFFYPAEGASSVTIEDMKDRLDAAGVHCWIEQPADGQGEPWIVLNNGDAALRLNTEAGQPTSAVLECSADDMDLLDQIRAVLADLGWVMDEETV